MTIRAWHFVGKTLRDGSPIPRDGKWLEVTPPIIICQRGLHASRQPYDALHYAPGNTLCLVDCDGSIFEQSDKLVCTRRRIVARMDATEMLRYYARMRALSVVHLWDAPDVVLNYLMTGDEKIRNAAYAAAYAADTAAYAAAYAADTAADTAYAADTAARAAAVRTDAAAARDEFNVLVAECFEGVQ